MEKYIIYVRQKRYYLLIPKINLISSRNQNHKIPKIINIIIIIKIKINNFLELNSGFSNILFQSFLKLKIHFLAIFIFLFLVFLNFVYVTISNLFFKTL
jgi:hypothetical protein